MRDDARGSPTWAEAAVQPGEGAAPRAPFVTGAQRTVLSFPYCPRQAGPWRFGELRPPCGAGQHARLKDLLFVTRKRELPGPCRQAVL